MNRGILGLPRRPFTDYVKGQWGANITYTQAHGLGRHPSNVVVFLECVIPEAGWAVGDRIWNQHVGSPNATETPTVMVVSNPVSVHITTSNGAYLIKNKTTAVGVASTNANWRMIIRIFD
jgi:hypothetical protein